MRLKLLQDKVKSKSHEIKRLKLNLRCTSGKAIQCLGCNYMHI